MRLQRTIGNQAVQRLLVQREPKGGAKQAELPVVVAKIVLEDGDFDGGSQIEGHLGEVEFTSLQLASRKGPGSPTGDRREREEQGETQDLEFTRLSDAATQRFFKLATDGSRIVSARFDFIRRGEGGEVETTFSLELTSGFVTSFQILGTDGKGRPSEAGSFSLTREPPR
jgi:type VI protein secretion system component Hcp